jgi:hypothetical protein
MIPNHRLYWNIKVPLKSITTMFLPVTPNNTIIIFIFLNNKSSNTFPIPYQMPRQYATSRPSDGTFAWCSNQSFHDEHLLLCKGRSPIQNRYAKTLLTYIISKAPNSFNTWRQRSIQQRKVDYIVKQHIN